MAKGGGGDYAQKFEQISKNSKLNLLCDESKRFIKELCFRFFLSFSDLKELIDAALLLRMFQEPPLAKMLPPVATKAELFSALRQNMQDLKASKSYASFTAGVSRRKVHYSLEPKSSVALGFCPVASPKTRCCNLLTLDATQSCVFDCSYCAISSFYKKDTVTQDENFYENLMRLELDPRKTYHIGTGQASDSLALGNKARVLEALTALALKYPRLILELKSKSDNVGFLLEHEIPANIITTWSLNPPVIIKNEEGKTAGLEARLGAARRVAAGGNLVGFHFHPMVFYDEWESDYRALAARLTSEFDPASVALVSIGTLTFTKSVIKNIKERRFFSKILQMPLEAAAGKFSYPLDIKELMFRALYESLSAWHGKVYFYLCMEDFALWRRVFGFEYASNDEFERAMLEAYTAKINALRQVRGES